MGEPNDGDVLRAAMTVPAFVLGGDGPGVMDHEAALTLSSQRPMIFQDSAVEMRDHVGGLGTAVETPVDHDTLPGCDEILRGIIFGVHLDVFCRALSGDLPAAGKKPVVVRFIQVQGWRGRTRHVNVIACGGVRQCLAQSAARR